MKDTTMIQHASSFSGLAAVVFFASAALQGCAVGSASNVGDLDDPAGQPAAAGYLFDLTEDQILSLYPLVESKVDVHGWLEASRAPFDCGRLGSICASTGPDAAGVATACPLAALAADPPAVAVKYVEPAKGEHGRKDAVEPGLLLGGTFNVADNRKVVGQSEGTGVALGTTIDAFVDVNDGAHEWRDALRPSAGASRTPAIDTCVKRATRSRSRARTSTTRCPSSARSRASRSRRRCSPAAILARPPRRTPSRAPTARPRTSVAKTSSCRCRAPRDGPRRVAGCGVPRSSFPRGEGSRHPSWD
jgi:hypothetical protein